LLSFATFFSNVFKKKQKSWGHTIKFIVLRASFCLSQRFSKFSKEIQKTIANFSKGLLKGNLSSPVVTWESAFASPSRETES
jgi:hypothetical protein